MYIYAQLLQVVPSCSSIASAIDWCIVYFGWDIVKMNKSSMYNMTITYTNTGSVTIKSLYSS